MSASGLPLDVVHDVMTNITDFDTLSSAILISKKFCDAFNAHPKSIVRSVTENVVGPAVAPALRLAQCLYDDCNPPALPDEERYFDRQWIPKSGSTRLLQDHRDCVRVLERFYSQRHKDRTSTKSVLQPDETLRFQRALYRYWLAYDLIDYYGTSDEWSDESSYDFDEDDDWAERMEQKTLKTFAMLFKKIPTEGLLDIVHIDSFCIEALAWTCAVVISDRQTPDLDPSGLAKRLDSSLAIRIKGRAMDRRSRRHAREGVENVLQSRGITQEDIGRMSAQAIVQNVVGAGDLCSGCGSVGGIELLGTPNIALLAGSLEWRDRVALLPGVLSGNFGECAQLNEYIKQSSITEKDLFLELIALGDSEGSEEQDTWSKDGWYCVECIKQLFRQRLMPWWREKKASNGAPVQERCSFGHSCFQMGYDGFHALVFDHLWAPLSVSGGS